MDRIIEACKYVRFNWEEAHAKKGFLNGQNWEMVEECGLHTTPQLIEVLTEVFPDVDWSQYQFPLRERRIRHRIWEFGTPIYEDIVSAKVPIIALAHALHYEWSGRLPANLYTQLSDICRLLGWDEREFRAACFSHWRENLTESLHSLFEDEEARHAVASLRNKTYYKTLSIVEAASGWSWAWRVSPEPGRKCLFDINGDGKILITGYRNKYGVWQNSNRHRLYWDPSAWKYL